MSPTAFSKGPFHFVSVDVLSHKHFSQVDGVACLFHSLPGHHYELPGVVNKKENLYRNNW